MQLSLWFKVVDSTWNIWPHFTEISFYPFIYFIQFNIQQPLVIKVELCLIYSQW